jgi:putative ABC transport system ATP-binding protein/lipoprotein-releasing system ATP-binding protein
MSTAVGDVLVRCDGAARTYGGGPTASVALQPTACTVEVGDQIALVGPSGSGKSTLLHLMAGLDAPTMGTVSWPAIGDRADLRPGPVAVVFQGPSLLPPLTVAQNVAFPLILAGVADADAHVAARDALDLLDLLALADRMPEEISGGQAQRVAVARALAGGPRLILADEPTGQLDHANGAIVVDVLLAAAAHTGAALFVSTHDPEVAGRLADVWHMRGGRLTTPDRHTAWSR